MMIIKENIKSYFEVGIPLFSVGVNNWALNKSQCITVIEELKKNKVTILGGDVYEMVDGFPEPNYDNWYCERNKNEKKDDFIARSIDCALEYINRYNSSREKKTYFVLVTE